METIRGGRVGLHSELRKYIVDGRDVDFDNPRLLMDIHGPPVLPSRWMLKKLRIGHSPIPVGIVVSPEVIAQRKLYQLRRARELYGTPEMTPAWKRYYLRHLPEIQDLL